jgi:hypothetical protein
MGATVKLVDLDGCGGVRGKVNPKTQVQKPNLDWIREKAPNTLRVSFWLRTEA